MVVFEDRVALVGGGVGRTSVNFGPSASKTRRK